MRKFRMIAAIILIFALCSCGKGDAEIVAYINGESVEAAEFMMLASRKKAEVVKYFNDNYHAEYGEGFWQSSYDGNTPAQMLSEKVLEELVPIKIQQKMAMEHGILSSCNYSDFLKRLETENNNRKNKKKNNEVVYGVTEYTPESYYHDEAAKMILAIKEQWKSEQSYDDQTLKEYYEQIRDRYYMKNPTGSLTLYMFKNDQKAQAEKLMKKAQSGEDITAEAEQAGAVIQPLALDDQSAARFYDFEYPGLMESLSSAADNIIGLLENGTGVYFAKVDSFTAGGYKEYDEVKSNVETMYIDQLYNEYIQTLTEQAEIKFTKKYESLDFSKI